MKLPDVLDKNLKLVFCGTAASNLSAEKSAYYAHPQNQFWPALAKVGLTPKLFKPEEFRDLLALGIGLTDLAKDAQGMDKGLVKSDFANEKFKEKILTYQPAILAFTSKEAGKVYLGKKPLYGLQNETIGTTQLWVLPSPSSAARSFWDITIWQALADTVAKLPS